MNQVGKPDAGNPPVRFDERGPETEQGAVLPPRWSSTLLKVEIRRSRFLRVLRASA